MVAFSSNGAHYGRDLQKYMAAHGAYPRQSVSWGVPGGTTVNLPGITPASFAANGTYTVEYNFSTDTNAITINPEMLNSMENAITYTYATTNTAAPKKKETMNSTSIVEALFVLKPKLRKKFQGDKAAFVEALLKAAEAVGQEKAYGKLDKLLGIEK